MEASSNSDSPSSQVSLPPKKKRRLVRVIIIAFCALVALVLIAPYVLSLGYLRSRVETELNNNFSGKCEVADVSFSWSSGLSVTDLRIANSSGFPEERPAVVMKGMSADVSIISLLFGNLRGNAKIDGLEVNVEQNRDGKSNLQELITKPETPAKTSDPNDENPDGSSTVADVAFDFALNDCVVTIRKEGKVLEKLSEFQCVATTPNDSAAINIDAKGRLLAGDLVIAVLVEPELEATDIKLVTHGLDLSNWQPLIDAFMPQQITALTGKVNGDITATMRRNNKVQVAGELTIEGPRIAGPAVQDMDLQADRWEITPTLTLGGGASSDIDASKFAIDLEWLLIQGQPATASGHVTLAYDMNVAKLAEFGGPMPAMLKSSGSRLKGTVSIPSNELPENAAGWIEALITNANLRVKSLDIAGFALRDVGLNVALENGELRLATSENSKLDGGALIAAVDIDLNNLATMPLSGSVKWQGGKLSGGATQTLRYVVPLFAGLEASTAQVLGDVNLNFAFDGPAMMQEKETILQWLDTWKGNGSLGLANTTFAPSKKLAGLLAPLGPLTKNALPVGDKGRLKIDSFNAPFAFARGVITSTKSEWAAAGQKIGLSGNVDFSGKIDYSMDFSSLLRDHKDGRKVLKALNGRLPPAVLAGSIDDPKLDLPELGNIAESLIKQQGKNLLEKGLKSLFKK